MSSSGDDQIRWHEEPDLRSLLHAPRQALLTTLDFKLSGLDGRITGYKLRTLASNPEGSISSSLQRAPADHSQFIRGKSAYFPFAPGGIDAVRSIEPVSVDQLLKNAEQRFSLDSGGIRTIPPGFERGVHFDDETAAEDAQASISIAPAHIEPHRQLGHPHVNGDAHVPMTELDDDIAQLLPPETSLEIPVQPNSQKKRPAIAKKDWAHVVDINRPLLNFRDLVPDMAKEYPFELDTFQKEAVYHLEQGDSVFCAAHTSAGKTVLAEYAIALAQQHMTRAIYTSPIKALSNQKFRDFKQVFGAENVGILTGDVQVNPEASCLIMTTEILRSMLYKGADLIRDVEWVIFDEVHYVNDLERGVVWEEVIIMLPDHIGVILLSATVPNTKEFAGWVGRTKRKDIYVISTLKRPVPLEHFLYAGRDLFKIVDSTGTFNGQGWKDAQQALKRKQEKEREAAGLPAPGARGRGARGGTRGVGIVQRGQALGGASSARPAALAPRPIRPGPGADRNLWVHLVGSLRQRDLLPAVIFTFSKKRCEENALSMPNTDLCTATEKSEIHLVVERSLGRLQEIDRTLPQILKVRSLLSKGIGVHHGGLLPIVKEIVEILFARGLVKILFATETFAMGVNMPARCVVFASTRKHDGRTFRDLLAGEYTQMAGRAGRRGLDATGCVIIVCNEAEPPETSDLHKMILGQPSKLTSQFRLTYSMILNLLRVETLRVEEMIKRSFSENASQKLLPEQERKIIEGEKQLSALQSIGVAIDDRLYLYHDLVMQIRRRNQELLRLATQSSSFGALAAGRVVLLDDASFDTVPAIILGASARFVRDDGSIDPEPAFNVMALDDGSSNGAVSVPRWPLLAKTSSGHTTYRPLAIQLSSIGIVTRFRLTLPPGAASDRPARRILDDLARDVQPTIAKLSQPGADVEFDWAKLRSFELRDTLDHRRASEHKLASLGVNIDEGTAAQLLRINERETLRMSLTNLRLALSDQNLELLPEYEGRISVLKRLGFIDLQATVLLKGRVACEINSGNALVLTELLLDNTLAVYEPAEVLAMLSAFVFQEKTDIEPILTETLQEAKATILAISERIASVESSERAEYSADEFGNKLYFGLVEVVHQWALGMPFEQIMLLTDVQEGTIVRAITRLDECCREVRDAARVIGDAELGRKMDVCRTLLRRDVVFSVSLYI
ncbi:uncharacterized protein L969DRAFT_91853 [Mixia osmundae IAM 14324]|uniref:Antiviral helicase n=1 Tax=Mixia osmundae (strain CBS 9802 / IAM 14324 / JCM 22182 / KY 12970) TaxID=764103 RepID=G7E2V7_MIXOS|nr:uncharacterized protein L969DRAFT_91853 [Mixia osmundae IAM 14324]KEI42409.1 hypothetical protein L969DRAFT_91853 [Mixia osmundae IAM 14324]GAA97301.1 hypothetical protein E5Q_03979 [Mixia osmundae IAM 14324]